MSKIFKIEGREETLVWNKNYLPSEMQAWEILSKYVSLPVAEMAVALSAGIDVKANGCYFKVELSTDNKTRSNKA